MKSASRRTIGGIAGLLAASLWTGAALAAPAKAPQSQASTAPPAPPATGQAAPAKPQESNPALPQIQVVRHTLPNGLRVVLNPDASSPTVAICVTYDVGSRNELKGRSGFAHLFEHMMFQGSRNVGKGEHFKWVQSRGGSLNGTTSSDRTNYFERFPANGLSMGLWLEADRMRSLAVNQQNFENQRKVVQEEYRMRVSNAAYATGNIELQKLVYQGYWPYEHDTIGSMADLDNAQLPWLREFHRQYYAPNNAVLAISGDFEPKATLKLAEEFFGRAQPSPTPEYRPGTLPPQTQARSAEVWDTNAKTPGLYLGWAIPRFREQEHYALELATMILAWGDSSILHQNLVKESSLLQNVGAWTYDHRGPDILMLRGVLSEKSNMDQVKNGIWKEIQRLASKGPTAGELNKAKQKLQSMFLFGLEGNQARARQLANYELFWGDADALAKEPLNYLRVTPEHVRQAVAKYLSPTRVSTVVVHPGSAPAAAPVGAAPSAAKPPEEASKQ